MISVWLKHRMFERLLDSTLSHIGTAFNPPVLEFIPGMRFRSLCTYCPCTRPDGIVSYNDMVFGDVTVTRVVDDSVCVTATHYMFQMEFASTALAVKAFKEKFNEPGWQRRERFLSKACVDPTVEYSLLIPCITSQVQA